MQRCFCLRQRGLRAHVPCVSKRWVPSCTRRSGVIWGDPRMQEIWLRAPPSKSAVSLELMRSGAANPDAAAVNMRCAATAAVQRARCRVGGQYARNTSVTSTLQ